MSAPGSPLSPAGTWHARLAFPLALVASFAGVAVIVFVPVLKVLAGGSVFGGDWGEYLYSAPYYTHGIRTLYLYPYPVLPVAYAPISAALGPRALVLADIADLLSAGTVLGLLAAGTWAGYAVVPRRYAALAGGLAIAGFPMFLYEVAWGGQAQLVAFVLGLLGLGVVVRNGIPGRSLPRAAIGGALFALAALTELYAATFLIGGLVLWWLLGFASTRRRREGLRSGAITLLVPLAVAGAVWASNPTLAHAGGLPAIYRYWAYSRLWARLWHSLTFGSPLLEVAYSGVIAAYAGFRLTFRSQAGPARWVVPAFGLSAIGVGALVTPVLTADRSLYLFGIPLGLAIAEMAAGWPRPAGFARTPRPIWRMRSEEVGWVLPALVVGSLLVAGVQLGTDVQILPDSLASYSQPSGTLSQIGFLSHEPGGIVFDSAQLVLFPTQWATDNPLFPGPAYQPYLLTGLAKQERSVEATALSYGPRWIDDGSLTVTDTEPEWGQPAPGLLLFSAGHLYETLEGNDFLNRITYSPGAVPSETDTSALFYAPSITTWTVGRTTEVAYNWTGLNATRTVTVLPNGSVQLHYAFDFTSTIPRSIDLYLTSPGKSPTTGDVAPAAATCSNASVSQSYDNGWPPPTTISFRVAACATGARMGSTYVPSDQYGIFELAYSLTPTNASVRTIGFTAIISPSQGGSPAPSVVTEGGFLVQNGIRWVVLSRDSDPILLERFADDPAYSLYVTTPDYLVLETDGP